MLTWVWGLLKDFPVILVCHKILESLTYGILGKPTWQINGLPLYKTVAQGIETIDFFSLLLSPGHGHRNGKKDLILLFLALELFLF